MWGTTVSEKNIEHSNVLCQNNLSSSPQKVTRCPESSGIAFANNFACCADQATKQNKTIFTLAQNNYFNQEASSDHCRGALPTDSEIHRCCPNRDPSRASLRPCGIEQTKESSFSSNVRCVDFAGLSFFENGFSTLKHEYYHTTYIHNWRRGHFFFLSKL